MKSLEEFSEDQVEELRAANQRLARQVERHKAKTSELVAAVYQAAKDAAFMAGVPPEVPVPAHDDRSAREEIALVHATDWQVGKQTDSYSTAIAGRRIGKLAEKVAGIAEIQRAARPVRKCALFLGGDMLENVAIFPNQSWEVDASLYEQVFATVRIIEDLVRRLLASFERVEVWDIFGNHGRLGRKGDYPRGDNMDRVIYRIAQEKFEGEKRLTWHSAESWYQVAQLGAYKALLIHGDQIRSFGGNLPAYGILRKVNAWAAGVLPEFNDAYIGHFHTPMVLAGADGRRIFVCGSPESGSEYAREFVAATGVPSQRLNFVDPKHGRVTGEWVIYLDK